MRTEKDCHELLTLFAKAIDTMVVGICILALVWFYSRRQTATVLPVLKINKGVNTKRFLQEDKKYRPAKSLKFAEDVPATNLTGKTKNQAKALDTVDKTTQTGEENMIWRGIWVGDDTQADSPVTDKHRTEVFLDFSTGEVKRTEQVYRAQHTHVIAPL